MGFEPKYGDCDNTLLFKIAEILNAGGGGGGGGSGVSSFNARTGAVTLTSGDVTGALGFTPANSAAVVTSFNTRTGAVTLTSGDVTTALGFTPANATALSNYVLKAGDTMTGLLQFSGVTHAGFRANNLTTAERDAIVGPAAGMLVFNTTSTRFNYHDGSAWTTGWTKLAGDIMTGLLQFTGTTHAGLRLLNITTANRNALTAQAGMTVWNINTNRMEYANQALAWITDVKLAGDTMTGLLTITQATANTAVFAPGGGSLTGADATTFFDYSGTWNTSAGPTAFKLNITNTASGASSLLLDLQSSTVSRFSVAQESTTLISRTQADTSGVVLALQKRGTTGDSTAAVANGDTISSIEARGWDTAAQGTAYTFRALALEAFTASAHGTRLVIGIPAIGSTTATARFDLRATALALTNGCTMNVALGTITAAQLVYDGSVTWNAAVTFTAHRVTVTNTSSNAASLLCDYIVGASSVFAVRVDGQIQKNGVELMNPLAVYAAGTVYTLTTTNAKITFGTTSPSLTITAPGTYALHGFVKVNVTGATFAANQTVTVLIRRINNTAANVTNSGTTYFLPIMTTQTQTIALIQMKEIFYATANSDDTLELWADVSALPSAGTVTVEAASLTVLRVS
jgi:hypothetical protein